MAEFPALPLWTDRYLADTTHLHDAEHGVYLLLLMHLWRTPLQRFPTDPAWIARKMGRSVQDFEKSVFPIMQEFMQCDGNWWTQKRLSTEWNYVKQSSVRHSEAAKSRWNKEKQRSQASATQQPSGNAPTPTPTISVRDKSLTAGIDLKAELFGACLTWLASLNGKDPDKYRSKMGQWVRDYGEERVLQAFNRARKGAKPAGDPVAWMERIINPPRKVPQI